MPDKVDKLQKEIRGCDIKHFQGMSLIEADDYLCPRIIEALFDTHP
jgi:hypothetical protein